MSACVQCGLPYCKEPEKHLPVEPPLHVRVATVLDPSIEVEQHFPQNVGHPAEGGDFPTMVPRGVWCVRRRLAPDHDCPFAWDGDPCECRREWLEPIHRYDTDWSATGPLIERLGFAVGRESIDKWVSGQGEELYTEGRTPLEAVCRLILALSAAGKLPSRP